MQKFHLEVTEKDLNKRLDHYLVKCLPKNLSRSFVQKLIAQKCVFLNNKAVKSHHKMKSGDVIDVTIPDPVELDVVAEDIPLEIVYEDNDLLVINKPAGMVVHPASGNFSGTLVNALRHYCKDLSGIGGVLRPGIVHRLDKDTSGLLVVAKNDFTHRELAKQFSAHSITRKYIAFVKGDVQLDIGTIEAPVGRHPRQRQKMAVRFSKSKRAVTHYRVLKRFKNYTMLELTLETGRTHQIRIHMSYLGYPLLGDNTYGRKYGFLRQALHAGVLGFFHPALKKYVEFKSELPPDMKELSGDK